MTQRLSPKNIAHLIEQTAYCLVDQETLDTESIPGRLIEIGQQQLSSPFGDTCSLNYITEKCLQGSETDAEVVEILVQSKPGTCIETQLGISLILFPISFPSLVGFPSFWLSKLYLNLVSQDKKEKETEPINRIFLK